MTWKQLQGMVDDAVRIGRGDETVRFEGVTTWPLTIAYGNVNNGFSFVLTKMPIQEEPSDESR